MTRPSTLTEPSAAIHLERRVGLDAVSAAAWDALAERVKAPPFMRAGWIEAWWNAFGHGSVELHLAFEGDELVGVLPLVRRGARLFSPTNWHTPSFQPLAASPIVMAALLRSVFSQRVRSVTLSFLDPRAITVEDFAAASSAHWRLLSRVLLRSPYLDLRGTFSDFERSLSANARADVRRRRRRLGDAGRLEIAVEDGSRQLDDLLSRGFAIEAAGWKGRRGTAITSRPTTEQFYREVARWAHSRGLLRLAFLSLDGNPISFLFDLEDGCSHYYLKGGYDPAFARFSPAKVLLYAMIERAFELGLERFEFLGADDPYKLRWATDVRELLRIQAFAPTPLGHVERLAYVYGRPLAKRVLALTRRR